MTKSPCPPIRVTPSALQRQGEYSLDRPPPLWPHLGQQRQQQMAQLLADLIRRMQLAMSNPEGSQNEL